MANSLEALKIFFKAILEKRPWDKDPMCLRKPWDQTVYKLKEYGGGEKLCFAMLWDNEIVKPHPPVHRAMKLVKTALEKAGHIGTIGFHLHQTLISSELLPYSDRLVELQTHGYIQCHCKVEIAI
jgi:hypothetical protein